jgi:hypothetical protein
VERNLSRTLIRAVVAALVTLVASACNSYPPGIPLPDVLDEVNATLRPNVIVLEPGDSVVVKSLISSKVDQTTKIRPDGRAVFPLLGELEIVGMTVDEVDELLTRLYEEQITAPDLLVRAGKLAARSVVFGGSVGSSVLPVAPGMTIDLVEALARMGIPKDTFTLIDHLVLIRWMPDEGRRRHWVIDAREAYWTHPELLYLQPHDIVWIPEAPLRDAAAWVREAVKLIPLPYITTADRLL